MTGPTHKVATPTTYILGAGFSKAVSSLMPLTDELGADCIARDPDVLGKAVGPGNEARPNFEVGCPDGLRINRIARLPRTYMLERYSPAQSP